MGKKHLYQIKPSGKARPLIVSAAVFCCLVAGFLFALSRFTQKQSGREAAQLEQALRRACVTCYAVEGRYPRTLNDLTERYGVLIDESRYAVRYDVFADNLLPEIRVSRKEASS